MLKNVFLCGLSVLILVLAPSAYAGKMELTTYYPAPTGEYQELATNRLKVGLNSQTPAMDGVANFASLASDPAPAGLLTNHDGDVYYNNAVDEDHKFRYYDSSADSGSGAWKDFGGSGGGGGIYSVARRDSVSTANASWTDIPDMTMTRHFRAGQITINFHGLAVQAFGSNARTFRILVGGDEVAYTQEVHGFRHSTTLAGVTSVSEGNHTVKAQYMAEARLGASLGIACGRVLTVMESE